MSLEKFPYCSACMVLNTQREQGDIIVLFSNTTIK
jgi:hypothetical protein